MPTKQKRQLVEFKSQVDTSADELFAWHWQPDTFEKLIPPWEPVRILERASGPEDGATATLVLGFGPVKLKWIARHCAFEPGRQFADFQLSGPFAFWHHVHRFEPIANSQCLLIDRIEYELPLAALSQPLLGSVVKARLSRMFTYRHAVTAAAFSAGAKQAYSADKP